MLSRGWLLHVRVRLVWLLAALLLAIPVAAAQQRNAALTVTVQDQTGAIVPGARLVLRGPGVERVSTTTVAGVAEFRDVPSGTYEVSVAQRGFAPVTVREIVLRDGDRESRTITLPVAGLTEDVSVAAPAGYSVPASSSGTKIAAPLMNTPLAIRVVPRAVIDDQKNTQVKDALENVSGVQPQPSLGLDSATIIRGFPNRNRTYRNGLRHVLESDRGQR